MGTRREVTELTIGKGLLLSCGLILAISAASGIVSFSKLDEFSAGLPTVNANFDSRPAFSRAKVLDIERDMAGLQAVATAAQAFAHTIETVQTGTNAAVGNLQAATERVKTAWR